jgi:D-alanine-D-alanine ligase
MKNVAILTGGPSEERAVSENSARLVHKYLSPEKYKSRIILMESDGWYDQDSGEKIDLNNFSLTIDSSKINFDFVFLMIHGTPAEDGRIQGYFEILNIPHSTCNTLSSALTFNKQMCKDYLEKFEIPMARSVLLNKGETATQVNVPVPVFVKPNNNGSSYGVSKVTDKGLLQKAIDFAFQFDDEVMVEAFVEGREFGCGVVQEGDVLHAFPVTEIIPDEGKDFFDYEAKYEGASQEITPADLSDSLTKQMQSLSKKLYHLLNCRGVVRFDYILKQDVFYLLEANTIPGMSEASIVPQQAKVYGWTIEHLLDVIIENCMS